MPLNSEGGVVTGEGMPDEEKEAMAVAVSQGTPPKSGAVSHQMVFDGVAGGRGPPGDPQLAVDRAPMEIDGGHPADGPVSSLGAGQTPCGPTQPVPLTGRH